MDTRLLVFARAPVAGAAKTRLIPALGSAGAATLHRHLVEHQLRQAAGALSIELWCAPDTHHPFFSALAQRHGVTLHRQCGDGLGERMQHALGDALQRSDGALLIGSDLPTIDQALLAAACRALQHDAVVLLPTDDGGYGLIGVRCVDDWLFEDIPWGTDQVLAVTRARLHQHGIHWTELPSAWDVDRPEDLPRLRQLPGWDRIVGELTRMFHKLHAPSLDL